MTRCQRVSPRDLEATRIEAQNLGGGKAEVSLWSADEGVKAGFVAALDGKVETNAFKSCGEFLRIDAQDFKIVQGAFCGRILGRVNRVGAPFDEEGEKAVAVVGEVDGFPVEDAAVGAFSGAVVGAGEGDLIFPELLGDGCDIGRMDGPADETRLGHSEDLREMNDGSLRRIGCDD